MSGGLSRGDVSSFVTEGSAVAKFEPFFQIIAEVTGYDWRGSDVKRRVDQLLCGLHGAMHCIITIPGYDWSRADQLARAMVQDVCRV